MVSKPLPPLRLTGGNILIETTPPPDTSPGGLVLVSDPFGDQLSGVVGKTGREVTFVRIGERVLCQATAAHHVEIKGKEYAIVHETDILLVFES